MTFAETFDKEVDFEYLLMTGTLANADGDTCVCNVDETFDTTSKPTKTESTKIETIAIGSITLLLFVNQRALPQIH